MTGEPRGGAIDGLEQRTILESLRAVACRSPQMNRCIRHALTAVVIGTAVVGCGPGGYSFNTHATYDVARLDLRMVIEASGTVPMGADLSQDGTFTAVLSRITNTNRSLVFLSGSQTNLTARFPAPDGDGTGSGPGQNLPWSSMDAAASLATILKTAGFTNLASEPAVLDEAAYILFGPTLGPKSTIIGSSSNVRAVKVSRQTKP